LNRQRLASGANPIIQSPEEVAAHALTLAQNGIDFSGRHVNVDTLCLHGDNILAAENARLIRDTLSKNKILVEAI
jgi:lactam utilization protein B